MYTPKSAATGTNTIQGNSYIDFGPTELGELANGAGKTTNGSPGQCFAFSLIAPPVGSNAA